MNLPFVSHLTPPPTHQSPPFWFVFQQFNLLVIQEKEAVHVPRPDKMADIGLTAVRRQYLGYLETDDNIHCYSAEVAEGIEPPSGMAFLNLRQLFGLLDEDCFLLAGRAVQIMDWDRTHQYCGRCGHQTENQPHERAKICPQCSHTSYPRLSPAMIVRVTRHHEDGPEILLARAHRFPPGRYSVLAGFVEPGESLEECVQREVCEEVGIVVKNIRYFGSQSWPFPNSLMIAFTAEYESGEIKLEEEEMADAGWYKPDKLPRIPPRISIARRLIDSFVAEIRQG